MAQTNSWSTSFDGSGNNIGLETHIWSDAVYDTNSNTSDWTFRIGFHDAVDNSRSTSGTWKIRLELRNRYDDTVIKTETKNVTISQTLSTLYYQPTFIATFNWNNIAHQSNGYLEYGTEVAVYIDIPTSSDYYDSYYPDLYAVDDLYWQCDRYEVSSLSATHANIGSETTISIIKKTNNALSTLYYSYSLNSGLVQIGTAYTSATSVKWTIPDEFYSKIPNDKQGKIYIYLDTFDNEHSQVGSRCYTTITAYTVESVCSPQLSPTITDVNATTVGLTGNSANLIRYKSNAQYAVNASARKSASITSIEVRNGSKSLTSATGQFNGVTSNDFTFTVKDSRGYVTSVVLTPTMVDYTNLTMGVEVEPPTADGYMSITIKGDYFNGSFGAASNSLEIKYRLKEGEGEFGAWTTVESDTSGGSHYAVVTLTGMNYLSFYTLEVYAVDTFNRIESGAISISTLPVFDWGVNDFNMNVDMAVYGTLTVNGDIVCTGSINGTQGSGGVEAVAYGTCLTEDTTAAKLVTCGTFTDLKAGSSIRIKFSYGNSVDSPTMNVNNTGVKPVMRFGTTQNLAGAWVAGEVKDFVYDGTYWIMVDGSNGGVTTSAVSTMSLETDSPISSFVMQSPNGTHFIITITDNGDFVATKQ